MGPAGTGAVACLDLNAKTGYASVGLKQVYRIETAGGDSITTCACVRILRIDRLDLKSTATRA